jgi:hypothetical protein
MGRKKRPHRRCGFLFRSQKKTRTSEGPAGQREEKGAGMRPAGVEGGFSGQNRMFGLKNSSLLLGKVENGRIAGAVFCLEARRRLELPKAPPASGRKRAQDAPGRGRRRFFRPKQDVWPEKFESSSGQVS